jgi:prenyltransferase beta subunit
LSGGSVYGCFLALSALQDLADSAVTPGGAVAAGMVACVLPLRRPEGGFANESSVPIAMTPSTAAAITVLTQTAGEEPHRADVRDSVASGAEWLQSSRCADGGFAAVEGIDSDLLSTATTLHALASRDRKGAGIPSHRDLTRQYVLGLREGGGFCGDASDRTCDCEYTFYGLLALGHLAEIADCKLHIAD